METTKRQQLINDFVACFGKAVNDPTRNTRVIVETDEKDNWGDERYYMIDNELGWLWADASHHPCPPQHEIDIKAGEWLVCCSDGSSYVRTRNTGNIVLWAFSMIEHGRATRIYNDIY